MQHLRGLVVTLLLTGCLDNVVALEPKAQPIKIVHETDRPLRCDVLGKISGTSRSADEKAARAGAENDLRNHAAELKANFALVEADRSGPVGTSSQKDIYLGGKALFCQTEEMEEAKQKEEDAARDAKEKEQAEQAAKEADEKAKAKAEAKAKKSSKK